MNRLNHIQQTLPVNLEEHRLSDNTEFILLDYSSSDGLSEWVITNFNEELRSGLLKFYRYDGASSFHRSHSRNLAFKLATGNIVCNLDADNFVFAEFTKLIHNLFVEKGRILVSPDTRGERYFFRDVIGRISCLKSDFMKVRGYDERLVGYGYEDNDLIERLLQVGVNHIVIEDRDILSALTHDDFERIKNEELNTTLKACYTKRVSDNSFDYLLLTISGTSTSGTITFPGANACGVLHEETKGTWQQDQNTDEITVHLDSQDILPKRLIPAEHNFTRVDDLQNLTSVLFQITMARNNVVFQANKKQDTSVNTDGFGRGLVTQVNYSKQFRL